MNLPVIRPVKMTDLLYLIQFAQHAGYGITSLPHNPMILEKKIHASERSFKQQQSAPMHELYLFCLEYNNRVVGTSGIVSHIGMDKPFFAYHRLNEQIFSSHLKIKREIEVLHLAKARKKPAELGSLFLEPLYRQKNWGKLLSFCRFLFMAQFRELFAQAVIAELRGVNHDGQSPFWEAIGRHFFQREFFEADQLRIENPNIIEELFPKHPIYLNLLPMNAQNVIGQIHSDTTFAQKILFQQGFKTSQYVDIFDGGPHLYANTDEIKAIRESQTIPVQISEQPMSNTMLISNTQFDFRATLAPMTVQDNLALIHPETAQALHVHSGDLIRYTQIS